MALEDEMEVYRSELPSLLQHEGKFVLIGQDAVAGIFAAYEDALKVGYDKFGLSPFLVKKIESIDRVYFISRQLPTCPT